MSLFFVMYLVAKVKSKVFHNHEIICDYFRKCGMKIGVNVHIYSNIQTTESYLIRLGDNTTISNDVQFLTHDNSIEKLDIGYSVGFGEIVIGSNCFIGARSIILGGVHLSDNVIVGAGSVVTKSFPEGSIIAGNPARLISSMKDFKEKVLSRFNISIEGLSPIEKRELLLNNREKLIHR